MTKNTLLLLCTLTYVYGLDKSSTTNLTISTPLGQLQGTTINTRKGATIFSFLGVRYAEAPVGDLRFQPPFPAKPWEGIYDATKNSPRCPQSFTNDTNEDCLFLNVYTRHLPGKSQDIKKPVMVFFHPGAFFEGTSSSDSFGPQYLMDQDIVLVVPNYRLQTLGFLATGTKEAPGNYGLKDQVQVLRWIKENIASFFGDPNDVTICGYSAGAASVTFHMVSPMSKGLFHKVIIMSGSSAFGIHPTESNQLRLAKKQAELVNCPQEPIKDLVDCLKTKTSNELTKNFMGYKEFLNEPLWLWWPVIEPDFGQERFLVEHPIKSILNNRIVDVPVMIGRTKDELGGRSYFIVNNETALREFDKDYTKIWPIIYGYERDTTFSLNVSEGLRKAYFPDNIIDASKRQNIADLYTDSTIGFGSERGARLFAENFSNKIYYYRFSFKGKYSYFYIPGTNTTYGASHHDDLLYLFYIKRVTHAMFTEEQPESKIVDAMTTMWGSFVKNGNPNSKSYKWPEYNLKTQEYLDINLNLTVHAYMFKDRYKTYSELFPLSHYVG